MSSKPHPPLTPRILALATCALASAFAVPHPARSQSKAASQPNVIVIVSDDQGYRDVGFNGSPDIPTPNIDRIAREGVRFSRGYVAFPVCAPSRAGLMTGRYPFRFGFERNPSADPSNPNGGVPRSELMLSEAMKSAGYATKAVGKWHLGTNPTLTPLARGFDEFYGFEEGGHQYLPGLSRIEDVRESKTQYDWYYSKLSDNGVRVEFNKYLTEELSDRATEFVGRMADDNKPFFLYLAYNAPHTPLQATEKYLSRFPAVQNPQRRTYMAMISAMDDGVGQVLAMLDKKKIAKNTIVFFLSDNGGQIIPDGKTARPADNAPLRGGKGNLFEGGIRVPFAVRWPAKIAGGRTYDRPVSSMDIYGTLASQIGLRTSPTKPLDGIDLTPYLSGAKRGDPHSMLFWRMFGSGAGAIVAGDKKYVTGRKGEELYDLDKDVAETTNLAPERASDVTTFSDLYSAWHGQMATKPAFPASNTWPKKTKAAAASSTD